jgi:hypothetical protein
MTTNTSQSKARVLETRYVWAPTIAEAMELAQQQEFRGWRIQGGPVPMIWNGQYGTGVAITRGVTDV